MNGIDKFIQAIEHIPHKIGKIGKELISSCQCWGHMFTPLKDLNDLLQSKVICSQIINIYKDAEKDLAQNKPSESKVKALEGRIAEISNKSGQLGGISGQIVSFFIEHFKNKLDHKIALMENENSLQSQYDNVFKEKEKYTDELNDLIDKLSENAKEIGEIEELVKGDNQISKQASGTDNQKNIFALGILKKEQLDLKKMIKEKTNLIKDKNQDLQAIKKQQVLNEAEIKTNISSEYTKQQSELREKQQLIQVLREVVGSYPAKGEEVELLSCVPSSLWIKYLKLMKTEPILPESLDNQTQPDSGSPSSTSETLEDKHSPEFNQLVLQFKNYIPLNKTTLFSKILENIYKFQAEEYMKNIPPGDLDKLD